MTQRLKASRHDGSALIRMRGMAASFQKCEMAVDVSESGVKWPGVGDELVSCHHRHRVEDMRSSARSQPKI